jgi:hypothetical protein
VQYEGSLKNGMKHGKGTFTFADGSKYVGEFKDNKKHGRGVDCKPDGSVEYSGGFKDGLRHGKGKNFGIKMGGGGTFRTGEWQEGRKLTKHVRKKRISVL